MIEQHGDHRRDGVRNVNMTDQRFRLGWAAVKHLEGRWYAGHRLFLHLIPPLAKYLSKGQFAVCSELAAKFLNGAALMTFWAGVNPDTIADMIRPLARLGDRLRGRAARHS